LLGGKKKNKKQKKKKKTKIAQGMQKNREKKIVQSKKLGKKNIGGIAKKIHTLHERLLTSL